MVKCIHGNAWTDDKIRAGLGLQYYNYQWNQMSLKYALTAVLRLTMGPVPYKYKLDWFTLQKQLTDRRYKRIDSPLKRSWNQMTDKRYEHMDSP